MKKTVDTVSLILVRDEKVLVERRRPDTLTVYPENVSYTVCLVL